MGFLGWATSAHPEYLVWHWPLNIKDIRAIEFKCSNGVVPVLLTDSGSVWQFSGGRNEEKPKRLSFEVENSNQLEEKRILKISVGQSHFLALDKDGKVWSWTDGWKYGFQNGQLGNGKRVDGQEPKMIEDGVLSKLRVVDIECGENNSYALTSEGLLFGWGKNQ